MSKKNSRNLFQHNKEAIFNVSLSWSEEVIIHNHPLVVVPMNTDNRLECTQTSYQTDCKDFHLFSSGLCN